MTGSLLVLLFASAAASCSDDDDGFGPGYAVGALCRSDFDCYPTTACIKDGGGVCALRCDSDYECGPLPYRCSKRDRQGSGGKISVCTSR